MKSPIKYYGGKSYMTDIITSYFPPHKIYVEGFGGGASILFQKERSPIEIYNDLGQNVYSLFKVISDEKLFDELKRKMDITPYSHRLREEFKIYLKNSELSLLDRAYYFLFVNRTSFNGVGGFSTTQCVRRGMSKSVSDFLSMIDRLPEIHNRLSSVIIENREIFDIIKKWDTEETLFYLDPPYVKSTRTSSTQYEVEMSDEEHIRLFETLKTIKGKFILSGYDNPFYSGDDFRRVEFKSKNSSSNRTEVLWMNF